MINKDIPINIVIADDNYNDHFLMKKALSEYDNVHITSLYNGEQTLQYVNKTGEFEGSEEKLPQIIILDVNMPKISGFEVYETLRKDEKFKDIYLAVLSSGVLDHFGKCVDIPCYEKPLVYEKYREVLEKIIEDWDKNKV